MKTATRLYAVLTGIVFAWLPLRAPAQEAPTPIPDGVSPTLPPAVPASDGHLVVTAPRSEVFVPAGSVVELKPARLVGRPDFTVRTLYLLVADQLVEERPLSLGESYGTFHVTPPRGASLKRVRIVALDDFCRPLDLMHCTIRSWAQGPQVPLKTEQQGETFHVSLDKNVPLRVAYLFLNDACLGKMERGRADLNIDLRALPAGEHRVSVVAANENGMLLPAASQRLTLAPRFRIEALEPPGEIRVPADDPNRTLGVNIRRTDGIEATGALVYIAGQFITERDRPEFVAELPLYDAPTGNVTVEVIGVGKDGFLYPSETLAVPIKNYAWEKRVLQSQEYQSITILRGRLNQLEADVVYWYSRALRVPSFTASNPEDTVEPLGNFKRDIRLPYLDRLETPGASGEYTARARKSVMEMAQIRLTVGRLYKGLRMWEMARSSFRRAAREAGETTPTGQDAQAELNALNNLLKRRR